MLRVDELVKRLSNAINEFIETEFELLIQDAHEEAISTALIPYFKNNFPDFPYHIDGQYDKRIVNNRLIKKQTDFLLEQLPKNKLPKHLIEGQKTIRKDILPDIIFHDRRSPDHNFLVVEIKKSTNKHKDDREFDLLKLKILTTFDLNYNFGAFIDFKAGNDFNVNDPYSFMIFEKGQLH